MYRRGGYSRERTKKPEVSLIAQVHRTALRACGLRERRTDPGFYADCLLRRPPSVCVRRLYRVAIGAIDLLLDVLRLRGWRIRAEARRSCEPLSDRRSASREAPALRATGRVGSGLRVRS